MTIVSEQYFDESFLSKTVNELESAGYSRIPNFFPHALIDRAIDTINKEIDVHGSEYFTLRRQQYCDKSVLCEICTDYKFKLFLKEILQHAGISPKSEMIHSVLRVSLGKRSIKGANKYHFDAYNLTALMPIILPGDQFSDKGDLIILPNIRPFSQNIFSNFIWKSLFQNFLARKFFSKVGTSLFKTVTVKMKPGDLILFFGYRTYHGNKVMDVKATRSTALFHFDDPHANSRFTKMIESNRKPPQQKN